MRHLVAVADIGGYAGDELIVGRLEIRKQSARLAEIELEPLIQRRGKLIGLEKGLGERLIDGFRLVQQCL
ncbi:MAG: hypothetical protein WA863_14025 [Methyloceanibacter sp.]